MMQEGKVQVLACYCSTGDLSTILRLGGSISLQRKVDSLDPAAPEYFRALICSPEFSASDLIQDFFDYMVIVDPYVTASSGEVMFCLSKFRNASIKLAKDVNADWLFLCDCDTIIARISLFDVAKPFCIPSVYWQEANETLQDSLAKVAADANVFSASNSWFIMHRDVFKSLDFNELIYGYGYEDIEFYNHASSLGYALYKLSDTVVIHHYHSSSIRNIDPEVFAKNRGICEAFSTIYRQSPRLDWKDHQIIYSIHPEWREYLIALPGSGMILQPSKSAIGRFLQKGTRFEITWGNGILDVFRRDAGTMEFKERG